MTQRKSFWLSSAHVFRGPRYGLLAIVLVLGFTVAPPVVCAATGKRPSEPRPPVVPADHKGMYCNPGNYKNGKGQCVSCPAGQYQDKKGASKCLPCPTGTFQDKPGQTGCKRCPPGRYAGAPGQTTCQRAPSGPAEVRQPGTSLYWLKCPQGQSWSGSQCTGDTTAQQRNWTDAKTACPSDYRIPSRQEFVDLLGGCEGAVLDGSVGSCSKCSSSAKCSSLFGNDTGRYWSSSPGGNNLGWISYFDSGGLYDVAVSNKYSVRCVRYDFDDANPPGSPGPDVKQPGTSLYCQRCPVGQHWTGTECTGDADARAMNQASAQGACPSGYRLPSRHEFLTLLGACGVEVLSGFRGSCSSCSGSETCKSLLGEDHRRYWSSSPGGNNLGWVTFFHSGSLMNLASANSYNARCVRYDFGAGNPPGSPGPEVLQTGAGLYWLRCPLGQQWTGTECTGDADANLVNRASASSACPSGYRLPTRAELVGLLGNCDSNVTSGSVGSCSSCSAGSACSALFGADYRYYWSSTAGDASTAWIAHFHSGAVRTAASANGYNVRCVRKALPAQVRPKKLPAATIVR